MVVVVVVRDSTIAPERGDIHTAPLLWETLVDMLAFVVGATKVGATTKGPGGTSTKALALLVPGD